MKNEKLCNEFDAYITRCTIFADDDEDAPGTGVPGAGVSDTGVMETRPASFAAHLRFFAHTLVCVRCAEKKRRILLADRIVQSAFLPHTPANCEDTIMAAILAEDAEAAKESGYFSLRGWAIAGIVIVASLVSVYFNVDFCGIAASSPGESFMLPLAITIGAVITVYGALFIGLHLKVICDKLGLEL